MRKLVISTLAALIVAAVLAGGCAKPARPQHLHLHQRRHLLVQVPLK